MIISLNLVNNKNKNDWNLLWKSQSLSHRFRPGGNCKSCSQQSQRCLWFVEGHLSCPSALSWHEPASRADEGLLQPPLLLLHRLFLQDPLRRAKMNGEHCSCWAVLYRWFYDSFNRSPLHFFLLTLPFSPTSSSLVSIVSEIYCGNFLRDFFKLFHRWGLNEACCSITYISYFSYKINDPGSS